MRSFDPVSLAVIANRLDSIVREMENTLLRTGRSAVLNMARDFSCALITADNRLLASAEGLPVHVIGMEFLAQLRRQMPRNQLWVGHPYPPPRGASQHDDQGLREECTGGNR